VIDSKKVVAYFRVSTKGQGESGLGLEAQEDTIRQYCLNNNLNLITSYTEIETSTKHTLDNRPVLQKALGHCKRIKATLIIAKLDRLARSVYVTSLLQKSGISFICVDMPSANNFTIHILAAVAEEEARAISERTKKSLKALKVRGVKLGSHRPECAKNLSLIAACRGRKIGAAQNRQIKKEAYADLLPEIITLRKGGMSQKEIASFLNIRGETTRQGCQFYPITISRLLKIGV
jgi:DNA invertase Pin-like site-specific DNA recombinase